MKLLLLILAVLSLPGLAVGGEWVIVDGRQEVGTFNVLGDDIVDDSSTVLGTALPSGSIWWTAGTLEGTAPLSGAVSSATDGSAELLVIRRAEFIALQSRWTQSYMVGLIVGVMLAGVVWFMLTRKGWSF